MTDQPRDEKAIFLAALEQPTPEARSAYVDGACGGNADLRRRVGVLLDAHQASLGPLDRPPPAFVPTVTERPITEVPGTVIGPYTLLEQIGEGGFGVVFTAEQHHPVRRKVALKVIKPGMDTRQVIARFEAERQALALMDHPNIAKVFDAGTTGEGARSQESGVRGHQADSSLTPDSCLLTPDAGRPYFVMELVRGVPITEYCDQYQLSPRERLELFLDVCHAVQHAHQKGIIHRDIKPSNVLVTLHDDKPVVKVIDFGVAKATSGHLTDKTLFTGFAQMVGTPLYMSPEQTALSGIDVDTRSDIYSLGVLLYELLTGTTPFDKTRLQEAAFDEVRRIIREEEPQKPSTRLSSSESLPSVAANRHLEPAKLTKLVRGELDWIVMKALEKDRARRYETANGFAADVLRYLADEPVTACPPSAAYRFRKFARRNKAALATVAMVAAALVAGIIGTSWQAIRATREADRATAAETLAERRYRAEKSARDQADAARAAEWEQRQIADQQKQRAEANFVKARRAVDEYLTQVTEEELLTVPGLQRLREDLLKSALQFYGEFTQERADDQVLQQELAAAHQRLSLIEYELGDTAAARAANLEAIRLFEQLRDRHEGGVDVEFGLAQACCFAGRYDEAVQSCQQILKTHPAHAEVRSLLAQIYNTLGSAAQKAHQNEAALVNYQRAFELRAALAHDYPEIPKHLAELAAAVNNVGVLLGEQGKTHEALAMYERAVGYSTRAYEQAPHEVQWGRWLCIQLRNAASSRSRLGRAGEALDSYQQLVTVSRKLSFENPAITALRGVLYKAHLDLARQQQQLGNTAEAGRSYRDAREVLENIPRDTPEQLFELATVYAALVQPAGQSQEVSEVDAAEQRRNADLALEALRKAIDAGYNNLSAVQQSRLLDPLRERDDFKAIQAGLEQSALTLRLATQNQPPEQQKLDRRQDSAQRLEALVKRHPENLEHSALLAATRLSIGEIQATLKQFGAAEQSLNEALRLREELRDRQPESPQALLDLIDCSRAVGEFYWNSDRRAQAHRLWQECWTNLRRVAEDDAVASSISSQVVEQQRRIAPYYGRLGLWKFASWNDADDGIALDPSPEWFARNSVVLALAVDDEALRSSCRKYDAWLCARGTDRSEWADVLLVWCAGLVDPPALPPRQLVELAQRAYADDTESPWFGFNLALAQYRAGEYVPALEILDRHFGYADWKARPSHVSQLSAGYLFALAAHYTGNQSGAKQQLQRAETLYGRFCQDSLRTDQPGIETPIVDFWWELAAAQLLRREAWRTIDEGRAVEDPWRRLIEARGYRLIGEVRLAEEAMQAAIEAAPNDCNVWLARAQLWQQWGEFPRAEADAQRISDLAGNDPEPWIQRGRWYAERGDRERSEADFAAAAMLTPHELNKFLDAGWWVVGPYPPNLSEFCPAELEPDPSRPVYVIDPDRGLSDEPARWRNAPTGANGTILLPAYVQRSHASAYALTYVYSPDERSAVLRVNHGDRLKLWVNGDLFATGRQHEEAARVPINLRRGRNQLLVKATGNLLKLRIGDGPVDRALTFVEQQRCHAAAELARGHAPDVLLSSVTVSARMLMALASTGDVSTYQSLVEGFFNRHTQAKDWLTGYWVAVGLCQMRNPTFESHADQALALVDAAVRTRPGEASLCVGAALVNYRADRSTAAQQYLDQVPGGDDPRTLPLRALLAARQGNEAAALEYLSRAEAEFAAGLLQEGDNLPACQREIWRQPEDWMQFCTLLWEAQQQINPNPRDVRGELRTWEEANSHRWENADPATAAYDHAVFAEVLEPSRALLARGQRLSELGRWDEAQADFDQAVERHSADPDVLAARGIFHARRGEPDRAAQDFHAALNLFGLPGQDKPRWYWGAPIDLVVAELDDVFPLLAELRPPEDENHWCARVAVLVRRGGLEQAAAAARRLTQAGQRPRRAAVALLRGDQSEFEAVRSAAGPEPVLARTIVLSLGPIGEPLTSELLAAAGKGAVDDPAGLKQRWLGLAQFRAGRWQDAINTLEVWLNPRAHWQFDAEAWPVLAMAYHQLGNHDQARRWLERSRLWIDWHSQPISGEAGSVFGGPERFMIHEWLYTCALYVEAREMIDGAERPN
jgi:serine/threonine protein kinase/tetratricopeptide (TPR) repeat protein